MAAHPGERERRPHLELGAHAKAAVAMAREEAQRLQHRYLGTEHILLGLLGKVAVDPQTQPEFTPAGKVLNSFGITYEKAVLDVITIIGRGDRIVFDSPSATPKVKKIQELAHTEAIEEGAKEIDTLHLLGGLIKEGGGLAAGIIESSYGSLDRLEKVRQEMKTSLRDQEQRLFSELPAELANTLRHLKDPRITQSVKAEILRRLAEQNGILDALLKIAKPDQVNSKIIFSAARKRFFLV